jgi:hypothetical protein
MTDMIARDKTTPAPDLAGCTREEKIKRMVAWFFQNFEDPAERTPYESAEGGYIYIWGEADARDVLDDKFCKVEEVDQDMINAAVDEIENDGAVWVPVPHPSDYE